jgi:hypothetical protein
MPEQERGGLGPGDACAHAGQRLARDRTELVPSRPPRGDAPRRRPFELATYVERSGFGHRAGASRTAKNLPKEDARNARTGSDDDVNPSHRIPPFGGARREGNPRVISLKTCRLTKQRSCFFLQLIMRKLRRRG